MDKTGHHAPPCLRRISLRWQLKRNPVRRSVPFTPRWSLAKHSFVETAFYDSGRRSRPIRIRIGTPQRLRTGEWGSKVEIPGVIRPTIVHGEDALQVLSLALEFVGNSFYEARRRGLQIRFLDGQVVPLHVYFRLREWRRRMAALGKRRGRRGGPPKKRLKLASAAE
jgi:hypothetical protein